MDIWDEDGARRLLAEAAVEITAIGVVSDRAAFDFNKIVRRGPHPALRARLRGTDTANYWVEGIAVWAAANPRFGVAEMRISDCGWPEFEVAGQLHVRAQRRAHADSARQKARQVQGPDPHRDDMRVQATLESVDMSGIDVPEGMLPTDQLGRPPRKGLVAVDITATTDNTPDQLIVGGVVAAPFGEKSAWSWGVDRDDIRICLDRWYAHRDAAPWLEQAERYAAVARTEALTLSRGPREIERPRREYWQTPGTMSPAEAGVGEVQTNLPPGAAGGNADPAG